MKTRNGIIAGGNWIVDFIKLIDTYPQENALANILEEKTGNGGAPFNVLKALSKMGVSFPLEGVGMVGDDETGRNVLRQCEEMGVDARQIRVVKDCGTSFTDVMTVADSGRRTFFHYRGASAHLQADDFDFSSCKAKIFHLGYLLLLDGLDRIDEEGRSGASRVLEQAVNEGILTSIDIVSEQSERYRQVVPSSLPFVDILFLNEFEAAGLTGIGILDEDGAPDFARIADAAFEITRMGVRKWIVFHFPAGAVAFNREGRCLYQPCVLFPRDLIRGTVGAGDAFAAGVLAGIHEDWPMEAALKSGVCVAASSLLAPDASNGIMSWDECMAFGRKWGFSSGSS